MSAEQVSADEKVTITVWVMTNKIGSKCERKVRFDREDWDSWCDNEKEGAIWDEITNGSLIEWGWRE